MQTILVEGKIVDSEKKAFSILYVEDEEAIRENYMRYLKRHFTTVYEAKDGEEAYAIYKEVKPQIMIIDINIPKLNGLELLKKVRENDHSTKAIMLTAYADVEYLLKASELKLTKYLIKPVSREDLKMALNQVEQEIENFNTISNKKVTLKDQYIWNHELTELSNNGEPIYLTNKERTLLSMLIKNQNVVVTYEIIVDTLWQDSYEDKLAPLKTIVKNLRKKLPKDTLKNVFGIGFKIII